MQGIWMLWDKTVPDRMCSELKKKKKKSVRETVACPKS